MTEVTIFGAPLLEYTIAAPVFLIGMALVLFGRAAAILRIAGIAMVLGAALFVISGIGYWSTGCPTSWYPGCGEGWNLLLQGSVLLAALGAAAAIAGVAVTRVSARR